MSGRNMKSALGRMTWGAHLFIYPSIYLVWSQVIMPYKTYLDEEDMKAQWAALRKKAKVDPDLFNPFTPVPFHNNKELKYYHSNLHRRTTGYIDHHLGYNTDDFLWKDYHRSFDHDNKNGYLYDFTSFRKPIERSA